MKKGCLKEAELEVGRLVGEEWVVTHKTRKFKVQTPIPPYL